jgi:hypothetical protein
VNVAFPRSLRSLREGSLLTARSAVRTASETSGFARLEKRPQKSSISAGLRKSFALANVGEKDGFAR